MKDQIPDDFFDLVDQVIHVANELTGSHNTSRVSAVVMYAAARYNAHCMIASDPEIATNRASAVEYFVKQYRSMLEENVDQFLNSSQSRPEESELLRRVEEIESRRASGRLADEVFERLRRQRD